MKTALPLSHKTLPPNKISLKCNMQEPFMPATHLSVTKKCVQNLHHLKLSLPLHPQTSKGSYQSGQMGLTVTQLAYAFGGSNPSLPTDLIRNNACVAQR